MEGDVTLRRLNAAPCMLLLLDALVCLTLEHVDLWVDVQHSVLLHDSIALSLLKLVSIDLLFAEFFDRSELLALLVGVGVERPHSLICLHGPSANSTTTHRHRIHHVVRVPRVYLFASRAHLRAVRRFRAAGDTSSAAYEGRCADPTGLLVKISRVAHVGR